jgi:inner membrane protein
VLGISGWQGLGLAVYSVAITLLTFWLATRYLGGGQSIQIWSLRAIVGNLLWSAILFLASVIAVRYIERLNSAALLGYSAYGLFGLLLSLLRARLQLRATSSHTVERRQRRAAPSRSDIVHNLTYILLALVLFLLLSWVTGGPANPILLIPLWVGALLPDLDSPRSLVGRLLPGISRFLGARLGYRQAWHTPAAGLVVGLFLSPLSLLFRGSLVLSSTLALGFAAHLLLDLFAPQGIMLLWPLARNRYLVPGAPLRAHGGRPERILLAGLAAVSLVLLVLVGIGPEAPAPPAPAPSYAETLERYHELRGRYLVFASVQGTWQTSGLRLSGRFEVLGAVGNSYALLDRYTGKVFTAGRSPQDHVYLDSINLQIGAQVQIKPVQIQLLDQPLAEGLAVLYEMQREPGLAHIYAFGDIVVAPGLRGLPQGSDLTGVPRIKAEEPGHYRLQYLTAEELIALANRDVEMADLLVVATYATPATGPTVTPLPASPASLEAAP